MICSDYQLCFIVIFFVLFTFFHRLVTMIVGAASTVREETWGAFLFEILEKLLKG